VSLTSSKIGSHKARGQNSGHVDQKTLERIEGAQQQKACRFRKLCGVCSGNSAVSDAILIVIEAGVTSQVLGAERGPVEA
jgi:hypothetical protein